MAIIGIDPGLNGYSAMIHGIDRVNFYSTPTLPGSKGRRLYDLNGLRVMIEGWRREFNVELVMIESQQPFPKQGGVSNFTTGFGFGLWKAFLTATSLRFDEVHPATWKRAMGIWLGGQPQSKKKQLAIQKAQSLWPGVDLLPTEAKPKARALSPDKAESLLIATYAQRLVRGGTL